MIKENFEDVDFFVIMEFQLQSASTADTTEPLPILVTILNQLRIKTYFWDFKYL